MPTKPARICTRCNTLVPAGAKCRCQKMAAKRFDAERGTSSERGYNATWQKFRRAYLQRNPLCVWVCKDGKPCNLPATDVDHIERISGPNDPRFYDESGLQPLCHRHHSAKTATEGRSASF